MRRCQNQGQGQWFSRLRPRPRPRFIVLKLFLRLETVLENLHPCCVCMKSSVGGWRGKRDEGEMTNEISDDGRETARISVSMGTTISYCMNRCVEILTFDTIYLSFRYSRSYSYRRTATELN